MIGPDHSRPSLAEKILVPPAMIGFCAMLFFFVDGVNARVAVNGGHFVPLETWLDAYVPFVPQFVFAYYLYYAWVCLGVFAVRQRAAFYHGVAAFIALQLAAVATFALLPSKMARPDVIGPGLARDLVRFMYHVDAGGFNLLPSLHVAHSSLVALLYLRYHRRFAPPIVAGTIAIGISTVFIKQHYVIDLPFGLLYALVAFYTTVTVPARVVGWAARLSPSASSDSEALGSGAGASLPSSRRE